MPKAYLGLGVTSWLAFLALGQGTVGPELGQVRYLLQGRLDPGGACLSGGPRARLGADPCVSRVTRGGPWRFREVPAITHRRSGGPGEQFTGFGGAVVEGSPFALFP